MKRLLFGLLALGACRGQPSAQQPLHLIGDMDWQPKFSPEEETPLWDDGRAMRPLVAGTVAQGGLDEDEGYYHGKVGENKYLAKVPLPVDARTVRRGQDRFNIYCAPCHDRTGSGQGMVIKRGYPLPINLTSERVTTMPDGQVFFTISNGVRNMPGYRKQIPVEDRWAIVTWVRVLGRSQNATMADVPEDKKSLIDPEPMK